MEQTGAGLAGRTLYGGFNAKGFLAVRAIVDRGGTLASP
jgi:hypothetical protein